MQKKLEAIYRLDKCETLNNIAKGYGVGTSTVGDWKKNRVHTVSYTHLDVYKRQVYIWPPASFAS